MPVQRGFEAQSFSRFKSFPFFLMGHCPFQFTCRCGRASLGMDRSLSAVAGVGEMLEFGGE